MDNLSRLIERVLAEKGWSLKGLADRCGIAVSTLHSWKKGDRGTGSRGPSPDKLRQLAAGAGLPAAEVFEAAGVRVTVPRNDGEELRFLHLFRTLSAADRRVLEATMRAMAERR